MSYIPPSIPFSGNRGMSQVNIVAANEIKRAVKAKVIYQILSNAFNMELMGIRGPGQNLKNLLYECDENGTPIRSLISQKLSELDKGKNTLGRINILIKYLMKISVSLSRHSLFHIEGKTKNSLSRWIKDNKKPDLSADDLECLRTYKPPLSLAHPSFSSDFIKEFHYLSQSDHLKASCSYFRIKKNQEDNCPHALLQHAIQAKKIFTVKYLLLIGANSNRVDKNYDSGIKKALNAVFLYDDDISFSILSELLEYRKPIQEIELFQLLDVCSQHYNAKNDPISNLSLFDDAISLLLGFKINVSDYFQNGRKLFLKYLAHIHQVKGIHEDKSLSGIKTVDLEGLHRDQFIQFHLRLFLQILVESVCQGSFTQEDFSVIYHEFLAELEMAWISQLLYMWKWSSLSVNSEKTKRFCDLLSNYTFKQIISLKTGEEYSLHVGWPAHSICVVFMREGDFLKIRIDNLGQACDTYHSKIQKNDKWHVQSRILKQFKLDNQQVKVNQVDISKQIKEYLSSLFLNVSFNYADNLKDSLVKNVYEPTTLRDIPSLPYTQTDNYYPAQIVGNCTFASFSLGKRKRLKDRLFNEVLRHESGILTSIDDLFGRDQARFLDQLSRPQALDLENPDNHFSFRLKESLNKTYQQLLPKESFPYIMQPMILKDTSFSYSQGKETSFVQVIHSLFNPKVGQEVNRISRIIIQGTAGVGKTILSKHFSKEWQQQEQGIVIYLMLRNLSNDQRYSLNHNYTLIEIIEKELLKQTFNVLERKLLAYELNREETVWVVDGLDELTVLEPLKEPLQELMKKKKLIVTSRPGIQHSQLKIDIYNYLLLKTYSEEEMHQFIDAYFSNTEASCQSREKIKEAIRVNHQIKNLCSVPITLSVICELVKQGNEEILVKRNVAELYGCFITAHLRETHKRQGNISAHVPDYKIRDAYRTPLRFMQFLAYESLKKHRLISASQEKIQNAVNELGKIVRHSLFEDVKDIGLVEITPFGAEFVHSTFQEYFAALYIVKSLQKPKNSEAFQNAKKFIEDHKFDYSYESLFLFILHQFIFLISEEKEENKPKLIGLLSNYISYFTQPIDMQTDSFIRRSPFLGVSLLNEYFEAIKEGFLTEENFITNYSAFIEGSFHYMLTNCFTKNVGLTKQENSLIPFLHSSADIDSLLVPLLNKAPCLKDKLKIYPCLLQNLETYKDHPNVLTIVWHTIFFIQKIQVFDYKKIYDLQNFVFEIVGKKEIQASLIEGLFGLSIDQTEKILKKTSFSPEDLAALQSIKALIEQQLGRLWKVSTRGIQSEIIIEKIIYFLEFLLKEQRRSPSIKEIKELCEATKKDLPHYIEIMFSLTKWIRDKVAGYCQKLLSMHQLGLSLNSIFRIETIQPLINTIEFYIQSAGKTDQRTGNEGVLSCVGFSFEHFLPIVDYVNPQFGDIWFQKLKTILYQGGHPRTEKAKNKVRANVEEAILCYQPYVRLGNYPLRREDFLRFELILEIFNNDYQECISIYSLEEKRKLFQWLTLLGNSPQLTDKQWIISNLCASLHASITEEHSLSFKR